MKSKAHILNETMLELVAAGAHFPLGIKAWQVRDYLLRDEDPISPEDLLGMRPDHSGYCLVDHYVDLRGYQFDWGTLNESGDDEEPEESDDPLLIYEVVPERVLMQYPRSDRLDTIFTLCTSYIRSLMIDSSMTSANLENRSFSSRRTAKTR